MNQLEAYDAGRIDAQTHEIKKLKGCVSLLAIWVTILCLIFLAFTYGHTH